MPIMQRGRSNVRFRDQRGVGLRTRSIAERLPTRIQFGRAVKANLPLLLLVAPGAIYLLITQYLPMYGVILAFKQLRIVAGGFLASLRASPWVGFRNFEFLFATSDAAIFLRNTIGYSLAWLFIGTAVNVIFALLITELVNRRTAKFFQTLTLFPHFISMVVVSFFVYVFLAPATGVMNSILTSLGAEPVNWYFEPAYWPFILTTVTLWKGTGMGSIIFIAAISGIDPTLYESAAIDGASKRQQVWHITLPMLRPVITILMILGLSGIMGADFGLFFQVPRDSGALFPATQVIETYVYRALIHSGSITLPAAAGLFKSVVGFVLIVTVNAIIRRIDNDNALY